jgi:hypothetical protein
MIGRNVKPTSNETLTQPISFAIEKVMLATKLISFLDFNKHKLQSTGTFRNWLHDCMMSAVQLWFTVEPDHTSACIGEQTPNTMLSEHP